MTPLSLLLLILPNIKGEGTPYCQPGESCWPTSDEIKAFSSVLSATDGSCMGLPSLSYPGNEGKPVRNFWYQEAPDPITPYQRPDLRQRLTENLAFFVVLPRNPADVQASVQFARAHNIGISVFSTGHEFNDRGGGPGNNTLLLRTSCLASVDFDLDENRFGEEAGVVRAGAGLTWGISKFGAPGLHQMARDLGRVVVSGHAGSVGIVGWSLGGGHGQLVPTYGMGVDQVVEVELVGADGSLIVANGNGTSVTSADGLQTEESEDRSLFWALRGGGAGPWGVVTPLTIRLHKPREECTEACYTQWNMVWEGSWEEDDGMVAQEGLGAYLRWTATASNNWSSYGSTNPDSGDGKYHVTIGEALYVGREEDPGDFWSLEEAMADVLPDKRVVNNRQTFDTFLDKMEAQAPESVYTGNCVAQNCVLADPMVSVLINASSAQDPAYAKAIVDHWIPRCYREGLGPACVVSYLFMHTVSTSDKDDDWTHTAVSLPFRRSKVHVSALSYISLGKELSVDEKVDFAHSVVGPAMYKFSSGSYYSESEYSLQGNQWGERFWGRETYNQLLKVKKTWDPELVFSCRHCIGDGEVAGVASEETLPTWRRPNINLEETKF